MLVLFHLSDLTAVIMGYRKKSVYVAYAVGMIPFKMFLGVLKTVRKTNLFNFRSHLVRQILKGNFESVYSGSQLTYSDVAVAKNSSTLVRGIKKGNKIFTVEN